MSVGSTPFRTHQCTRQLPPLRRQLWIKLMHSLKCFLLEKKATGKGVGGSTLRSCLLLTYRHQGTENPRSLVWPACTTSGDIAPEGDSIAGRRRGWPHHLGRRLSSRREEQASTMGVFWLFKDMGVGRVRCHFSGVCNWKIWNNSSGLGEEPQKVRLQSESILSSRYWS